jgi:glycosyltransferase involved in cell wall biosynthesis
MLLPRVAIDFRWLDGLCLCNGQYRYAVDLIRGLADLRPSIQFVVLGSRPEPVPEVSHVFADCDVWQYRYVPRFTGRAALYREHARYQRLTRTLKVDLFHALHSFVPLFPPVPVIETVYDMMLELFPEYGKLVRSREYRLHRWAFRKFAARAIAISQTTATDLERLWGFPRERTDVVYLGTEFALEAERYDREEPPIILAPFNLEPRKNLTAFLVAVAKLRKAGWRFRLVLFGRAAVSEEREAAFQEELRRLDLESCTSLTGRIDDEALSKLYRCAPVFVFPSLYEGFGLPVLEAMSAACCVLAHNESAMAEVLGDAGWRVDMRSPDAICGAIISAMHCPEMGQRAAERARQFSRERMTRETVAVYEKALAPDSTSEMQSEEAIINVAVAEKLATLRTIRYFEQRARRANRADAFRILERMGANNPPAPGDELSDELKPVNKSRRKAAKPSRPKAK